MVIEAFIISILVGLVRKGNIRNLARINIRCAYLFLAPFLIFSAVCLVAIRGGNTGLLPYVKIANIVQFVGLLAAIACNLDIAEMRLAGLGCFSNFLAVAANGGVMPMGRAALQAAGMSALLDPMRSAGLVRHSIATPETRLRILTDILTIPEFTFLPRRLAMAMSEVDSIGDVLISIAVFILVQHYMCLPRPAEGPSAAESAA